MGYNQGATIFQHDFLNAGDDELPEELLRNDKELLILINPPYGNKTSAASYKTEGKRTDKKKTVVAKEMNLDKMNHPASQMYAQFIYRLIKLKIKYGLNMKICMFTPESYITKPSFKNFRKLFYNNFEFKSGFVFQASEFADVSSQFGICFTCWESK